MSKLVLGLKLLKNNILANVIVTFQIIAVIIPVRVIIIASINITNPTHSVSFKNVAQIPAKINPPNIRKIVQFGTV